MSGFVQVDVEEVVEIDVEEVVETVPVAVYVTCTPSGVTKITSTGVPAGTAEEYPQENMTLAVLAGAMGLGVTTRERGVLLLLLVQIRVPLVNSSSPRVIEVEGLPGGL